VIFGAIFGGMDTGPNGIRLALLNESSSPVAKKVESTLDTMKAVHLIRTFKDNAGKEVKFDSVTIKEYVRGGNASAALVLPADMFTDTSEGIKAKLLYDPKNDIEMQMLQGIIQQTLYQQISGVFGQINQHRAERRIGVDSARVFNRGIALMVGKYFDVDTTYLLHPSTTQQQNLPDSIAEKSNFFGNAVRMEQEQLVGKEVANPWATRSVGGWAMMFLLFTLTGSASSLLEEKKEGLMLRLLASPISRTHILWSKYLFNMSLGVIQLIFLFIVGWILFRIDIFSNFFNLFLIVIAASTACTAFGMMIAAFCRTHRQANGLGTLLILSMSAVGGAWFPTSFMPSYIQFFSKLTLIYWSMDGFLQVLWRGVSTLSILPNIGILLGIAAIINTVSVWRFKKGNIF
jgi:ABC-2 type transport system permease protein